MEIKSFEVFFISHKLSEKVIWCFEFLFILFALIQIIYILLFYPIVKHSVTLCYYYILQQLVKPTCFHFD